ncbi:LysR family transcriptional regulator [Vibrio gazogenes]|uniref:DNA-binding transcriptional regulator, LysR family n=1 Tax=Vibrio gazogenes DSM 21264 = NBRC 103151 TaxID=1123492 RepID=A0A1M4TW00_VIBGA|nr:LysR family transcriptional regulator [Vibrio gazogenes]USP16177.1 LysR family transcriptional regulator [Vibrio gazogenes]SHE48645.1 DNA-binding transcriptional regulator, LysR family [Vibrio gazogenes DSM 21264] [Vibrio gazogenes DSM 21264 = NBRC 103151]SJN53060.1 Nodulation protein D 2 [Vibrio gazogenes]
MDMDINQLRLLVVLDKERNLSNAARKLFISQSAASHVLSKLRNRFDNPLFIKTRTGMEPTPLVRTLLPDIQKGLNAIDMAFEKMKPFNPALDAKTFYIGAIDYFEFYALPKLGKRLESSAPNVRIAIDILSENMQMERVEQGHIDLILGVDELQIMPRYYNRYHWLTDTYVGIVSTQASLPDKLTLNQFLKTPQIHLPLINSGGDPIDRWLHQQHQARQISMIVQSFAVGGMVTVQTNSLMCVPLRIALELQQMLPVRIIELPEGTPELSLSMFTHQLYDSQDSIQWLIQEIHQCVRN